MSYAETFLNLTGARRLPTIRQSEATECGLACLAMVAGWYGYDVDLNTLRRRFPVSLKGMTLKELIDVAGRIGLGSRAVRCGLAELKELRTPCVLHWEFKHFVVLRRVAGSRVLVHDPAFGVRVLSEQEASAGFTGVALELTPTPRFETRRERNRINLSKLWQWNPETRSAFAQALFLSCLLEIFVVINPLFMQLVVDEAILKGDNNLLVGLAVAFSLFTIFNAAVSTLRAFVLQFLANIFSFDIEARLFHHLIRLPLEYFQKRSLGDLLQRFHALEPIKNFIVSGGISAILDGSLAIFTGALMLVYSAKLSTITFFVVMLYMVIRLGALSLSRHFASEAIIAETREQTRFLETLRAMQTIKISAGEANREAVWRNLYAEKINASIRSANLSVVYANLNTLLSGLSDVAIIYLAARDAISGLMTVGMITAFMAYKGQFTRRMIGLLDQLVTLRLLDVQLDRVGDVALAEREAGIDAQPSTTLLRGQVTVRGLKFRYSASEPEILKSADLAIEAGEFIAIVGPSGEGKSTLLKILIGLLQPTDGEILIDDQPIGSFGTASLRSQLGVVMQEDQLLAGTIAENIALFDELIDMERVRQCAKLAAVDEEIMVFPMQFNSLVGDMGTTLSSGQKQRVLIARALYRQPKILVLDEGTAHLDADREARINAMLKSLAITRIVVAHGSAMIRSAERVFELRGGVLSEMNMLEKPMLSSSGVRTAEVEAISGP